MPVLEGSYMLSYIYTLTHSGLALCVLGTSILEVTKTTRLFVLEIFILSSVLQEVITKWNLTKNCEVFHF